MHCRKHSTDLTLQSPLPKVAIVWFGITLFIALLYCIRATIEIIPPQDHFALSIVLCFLLGQVLISMEQTVLKISLPYNRAWLKHHRFCNHHERSLPVSQIHSARLEYSKNPQEGADDCARIVLVTALGMIPVTEEYEKKTVRLRQTCTQINRFLESQTQYFTA